MFDRKLSLFAGLTLFTLVSVSGCGDKEAGKALEAAASVNGQVVAAEQIENELKKLGQVPPDRSRDIANRILKNVLDQELLAQQAVQAKLADKSEVRMKIDAARRQILAEGDGDEGHHRRHQHQEGRNFKEYRINRPGNQELLAHQLDPIDQGQPLGAIDRLACHLDERLRIALEVR